MSRKSERMESVPTGGVSKRTDRAVRRAARATRDAARTMTGPSGDSGRSEPVRDEGSVRYPLVCKLFARVNDLNRTTLARIPFDENGRVSATLNNWPSAVDFEYEIWWGCHRVDASCVDETEIRSDEGTLVFHVQLGD